MIRTIFCIGLLTLALSLTAQIDRANGLQLTGQVQMGLPQNEFSEVFNGYPSGLNACVTLPVGKTKLLRFGGEYGWNSMGSEKTLVELRDEAEQVYNGEMDFSSEIRKYHAMIRLAPFRGGIRPYLEAFFGVTVYQTESELSYESADGTYVTETRPKHNEGVNSYGYGGGLMLGISKHLYLDGKVQVLRGGEVRLVDLDSLTVDSQGGIDYNIQESNMHMIVPQVGLSLVF
ncbi:MAG: hypothetical protein HKN79_03070 [Flavobacteriales bacterium]|nr:hypothetical protein [Flavobacteriales bacterium]